MRYLQHNAISIYLQCACATCDAGSALVCCINSVLVDYLSQNNLGELLRLAETLASKNKARD